MINFNDDTYINPYGKVIKFIKTINNKPLFVQYIPQLYNEYDTLNNNVNRIYATSDGSIIDKHGGVGLIMELHVSNNEINNNTSKHLQQIINDKYQNDNNINVDKYVPNDLNYQIVQITQDYLYTGISYCINVVELIGIKTIIKQILLIPRSFLLHINSIQIKSDNDNAILWLTCQNKTTDPTYIKIISNIYKLLNKLYKTYDIITYFQRCKRETYHGIIVADRLAKIAAKSYPENQKIFPTTPIAKSTFKKLINKHIYECDKTETLKALKNTHIISQNIYKWKYWIMEHYNALKELNLNLTQIQSSILIQLRSEQCPLNTTKHKLNHYKHYEYIHKINNVNGLPIINKLTYINCKNKCCSKINSGRCNYCIDEIENVNHYIMDCSYYKIQRKHLFYIITSIYHQYQIQIELKTILFPPKSLTWKHRKLILSSISNYAIETKRFANQYHIPY